MTQLQHNKNNPVNPEFIVVDEADLLLEIDQNAAKCMKKIIMMMKSDKKTIKSVKNLLS